MSDDIDAAQEREEQLRAESLRYRKPVPTTCERCTKPAAILGSGARARFCKAHLAEHVQEMAGDLDAV